MKRFRLNILIIVLFLFVSAVQAGNIQQLDEVLLEEQTNFINNVTATDASDADVKVSSEKTLKEKLEDIKHQEIYDTSTPTFLLREVLTKKFDEDSVWDSIHVGAGYTANANIEFINNGSVLGGYTFNAISPFIEGKTKDDKFDFKLMTRFSPLSDMNWMQYLVSDAYVATNVIPHHRIQVGNFRPPVGYEGALSTYVLDFTARSQLARTLGTTRKFGARIKGDYSLIDYDIGGYSSDTFWQEFFPGGEFIGWLNLKPLGLTNGKYGNLTLGGGVQTGHRDNTYTVASTHVGYSYKKFNLDFEWANADGYNGYQLHSTDKHAGGFYISASYKITPKLQILACFDEFNYDKSVSGNKRQEYTAGINYFIKGQGMKLMLNYSYCRNENTDDSHCILLGTQLLL